MYCMTRTAKRTSLKVYQTLKKLMVHELINDATSTVLTEIQGRPFFKSANDIDVKPAFSGCHSECQGSEHRHTYMVRFAA